jgi:hypothetical protein
MTGESKTLERRGLAKGIKVWLDVLFFLTLLAGGLVVIVGPLVSLTGQDEFKLTVPVTVGKGAFYYSKTRGQFSTREVSVEAMEGSSISPDEGRRPDPFNPWQDVSLAPGFTLTGAQGKLLFLPPGIGAGILYWSLSLLLVGALAYGLLLLRQILSTTVEGFPFHPRNPRRLNHLGWIVVASSIFATVSQFLFGRWALSYLGDSDLLLFPSLVFHEEWFTCGLLILVLAAIWKEAVRISEEQSLTV